MLSVAGMVAGIVALGYLAVLLDRARARRASAGATPHMATAE